MKTPVRKVLIPGGSGFLGRALTRYWQEQGAEVVVLSRGSAGSPDNPGRRVHWNGESLGPWTRELDGTDLVINLAGRSVNCRYNAKNRREILESRLRPTRALGQAIADCKRPPALWINAGSATIYRHALDRPMDETTGEIGHGFSVDVCLRWEQEFREAPTPDSRKVALRTALVLGSDPGGALEMFLRLTRLGLGGTLGPGTQYVSWVHVKDFVRSTHWLVDHPQLEGAVNCAAPHPLPNCDFMQALRRTCHQSIGLPAASWMLEIGAFLLRTETELLLKSRWVVPARLLGSGFCFCHPQVQGALEDLVAGTQQRRTE